MILYLLRVHHEEMQKIYFVFEEAQQEAEGWVFFFLNTITIDCIHYTIQ